MTYELRDFCDSTEELNALIFDFKTGSAPHKDGWEGSR